jgi:hypothetical protein
MGIKEGTRSGNYEKMSHIRGEVFCPTKITSPKEGASLENGGYSRSIRKDLKFNDISNARIFVI